MIAAVAVLSINVQAQDDERSRKVINDMIEKVRSYSSMTIEFETQFIDEENDINMLQVGVVQVNDKKFHLVLEENTVISNGETVWTYSTDLNEVTINDPEELGDDMDPSQLFTMYEKGFKSVFLDESTLNGKPVYELKLFPLKPAEKPYHTVLLTVNKNTKIAEKVVLLYKEGNEVSYMITKFTGDPTLPADLFIFNKAKYPGVEVNDMR